MTTEIPPELRALLMEVSREIDIHAGNCRALDALGVRINHLLEEGHQPQDPGHGIAVFASRVHFYPPDGKYPFHVGLELDLPHTLPSWACRHCGGTVRVGRFVRRDESWHYCCESCNQSMTALDHGPGRWVGGPP